MRAVIRFADQSFCNIRGDRMEISDNMLLVYCGKSLVGVFEMTCILSAYLSKQNGEEGQT